MGGWQSFVWGGLAVICMGGLAVSCVGERQSFVWEALVRVRFQGLYAGLLKTTGVKKVLGVVRAAQLPAISTGAISTGMANLLASSLILFIHTTYYLVVPVRYTVYTA